MSSVNKVIIVGRLGQDPEVRQFQNGNSVTNISVATSERWMDRATGEQKEKTEWHKIVLQNRGNYRLGDIAVQYLRKGSLVYIEGSLSTRKYTDQQGIERYVTEIRADNMTMLGSANQNQDTWNGQGQSFNQNHAYTQNTHSAQVGQGFQNHNNQNHQGGGIQNHQNGGYANQAPSQPQGQHQYTNNNPIQGINHQNHTQATQQGGMKNAMSSNQFNEKPSGGMPREDDIPF